MPESWGHQERDDIRLSLSEQVDSAAQRSVYTDGGDDCGLQTTFLQKEAADPRRANQQKRPRHNSNL